MEACTNKQREIIMDKATFCVEYNKCHMFDLKRRQELFLFHWYCKKLERVSTWNATWGFAADEDSNDNFEISTLS